MDDNLGVAALGSMPSPPPQAANNPPPPVDSSPSSPRCKTLRLSMLRSISANETTPVTPFMPAPLWVKAMHPPFVDH
ncbi:hypothetical protein QYQ99_25175 [Comamonas testosteroni]|uniref:hypothetical protein n=1 Tax=Comamonas testosteroni TaxID=285 RepID=UPI00265E867C|nr:hypothetical protein [Comamonas testosteroni]WKL15582.1 hypothetical protein QYQ99_25175 [Comamonas testosteroni]